MEAFRHPPRIFSAYWPITCRRVKIFIEEEKLALELIVTIIFVARWRDSKITTV